jgi:hypothetical protein
MARSLSDSRAKRATTMFFAHFVGDVRSREPHTVHSAGMSSKTTTCGD